MAYPKKKFTFTKIIFILLFTPIVLFYTAIYIVVSSDSTKQLVAKKFAGYLNAKIIFDEIHTKIFPYPHIQIKNIRIFSKGLYGKIAAKPLLKIDAFDVYPELKDLLALKLSVGEIILHQPVFNNFHHAEISHGSKIPEQEPTISKRNRPNSPQNNVQNIIFTAIDIIKNNKMAILGGKIIIDDNPSLINNNLSDINVSLSSDEINAIILQGNILFRGSRIGLQTYLRYQEESGSQTQMELAIQNEIVDFQFNGDLIFKEGTNIDGKLNVQSDNINSFMHWLGAETKKTFAKKFSLLTHFTHSEEALLFNDINMELDESTVEGKLKLLLTPRKPSLFGTLNLNHLDLNYLYFDKENHSQVNTIKDDASSNTQKNPNNSLFEALELDLRLSIGNLFLPYDTQLTNLISTIQIVSDEYHVAIGESTYNGGQFKGFIKGQKKHNLVHSNGKFTFDHVQVGPLIKNFFNTDFLTGNADIKLDLHFKGFDIKTIKNSLWADVTYVMERGVLKSYYTEKFMALLRKVSKVLQTTEPPGKGVDIMRADGHIVLDNMILDIKEVNIEGPYFNVNSSGDINLNNKQHSLKNNVTLWPKSNGTGLNIPFNSSQSISDPHIIFVTDKLLDLEKIIQNPSQAYKKLKNISDSIKKNQPKQIFDKLLQKP